MPYVPSKHRVCAYSYREQPSLLRCGKCKDVYYVDAANQRAHWPLHKQVCCKPEDDEACDEFDDIHDCIMLIHCALSEKEEELDDDDDPILKGRTFLCALQYLKNYLHEHDNFSNDFPQDVRGKLEGWIFRQLQDGSVTERKIQYIWSSPGFANYFLSEQILLSPAMQRRKDQNQDVDTIQESDRLAPLFYEFLVRFFYRSALSFDNPNQTEPRLRSLPLAAGVVRQIMRLWKNPYSREGIPTFESSEIQSNSLQHWLSVPQSDFFYMVFKASYTQPAGAAFLKPYKQANDMVPAMTAKEFFVTVLRSNLFTRFSQEPMGPDLLTDIYNTHAKDQTNPASPFSVWTISDRMELLDLFHSWKAPNIRMVNPDVPMSHIHHIRDHMVERILGGKCNILLKLHAAVQSSDCCSPKTKVLMERLLDPMMNNAMIFARAYVNVVEPKYVNRQRKLNQKAQPFPEEVIEHIAGFRFPTTFHAIVVSHLEDSDSENDQYGFDDNDGYNSDY